jgi:predicted ATP-dependent protease
MQKSAASPSKSKPVELTHRELRWTCDPSKYDLSIPEKDKKLIGIIGQDRAIKAMQMGIELYSPGYNVFVCGITGTGRTTTVKRILDKIKSSCPLPLDRCFVHNFQDPCKPRLIVLPRGKSRHFKKMMEKFAREINVLIPHTLDSEDHVKKREGIVSKYEKDGDRLIEKFERHAEKTGFALKRVRDGNITRPELFPMVGNEALHMSDVAKLVEAKKLPETRARSIQKGYLALRTQLEAVAKETRKILEKMETELAAEEQAAVAAALQEPVKTVLDAYPAPEVANYMAGAVEQITDRAELFSPRPPEPGTPETANETISTEREELLALLEVNSLLDNTGREECPVVIEKMPTYRRLFGYFDKTMDQSGHWTSDFRQVRAGSLLQADGGYLVLNAEEVLRYRGVWQALKSTLVNSSLELVEEGTPLQAPVTNMTPEPVTVNVKVILIGDARIYSTLYNQDRDFKKIFKVLADFDYDMELNKKNLKLYAAFVGKMCAEEGLAHFDQGAVAAVAEHGVRKAGKQGKLTARFGDISDLLREADYWRKKEGKSRVSARHIKTALHAAAERNGLWEDRLRELITSGMIRVEVKGAVTGQINGLQVRDTGYHAFGSPARITAATGSGNSGIINIERESHLSGRSHNKGVLIIGGFFRERFGQKKPLAFAASLAFEQSYGGIDGDSASSTEIYAILSALTSLPVQQGIAVTGSVDQKGIIQPVGGVNLKIEGFFEVCRLKGLTGKQGVIMPRSNVSDLMLNQAVVEAVKKKKFHIYPVSTIEEGIEILTGVKAGARDKEGKYPENSVLGKAERKLAEFSRLAQKLRPQPKPATA